MICTTVDLIIIFNFLNITNNYTERCCLQSQPIYTSNFYVHKNSPVDLSVCINLNRRHNMNNVGLIKYKWDIQFPLQQRNPILVYQLHSKTCPVQIQFNEYIKLSLLFYLFIVIFNIKLPSLNLLERLLLYYLL